MIRHGTKNAYNYHRCRCDLCRKAAADYRRIRRNKADNPINNTHHWPLQRLFDIAGTTEFVELGYLTGFATRTIHRWQENGIPDKAADQAACALGLHPCIIWPDWFDPYLKGAA